MASDDFYQVVGAIDSSSAEVMTPGEDQIFVEKEDGTEVLLAEPKDSGGED